MTVGAKLTIWVPSSSRSELFWSIREDWVSERHLWAKKDRIKKLKMDYTRSLLNQKKTFKLVPILSAKLTVETWTSSTTGISKYQSARKSPRKSKEKDLHSMRLPNLKRKQRHIKVGQNCLNRPNAWHWKTFSINRRWCVCYRLRAVFKQPLVFKASSLLLFRLPFINQIAFLVKSGLLSPACTISHVLCL